jgi:hypothetical protein
MSFAKDYLILKVEKDSPYHLYFANSVQKNTPVNIKINGF